jgi:Tfp pilus assembly protein PilF
MSRQAGAKPSQTHRLPSSSTSRRLDPIQAGSAFLIIILCFSAYANSLSGDFVWDDQYQIVGNDTIRSLANLPHVFGSTLWEFMSPEGNSAGLNFSRYYRPIQTLIYMSAYKISGLSPLPFHLFNVGLHSAVCVLVYILCLQLSFRNWSALLAAALFAVHPIHTEAVSWIAGVGDLACGLFYFSGLCAYVQYFRTHKKAYLWGSAACCLLALLSKEAAITFPIVAAMLAFGILLHARPKIRDASFSMLSFAMAFGVYAVLRMNAMGLHLPPAIRSPFTAFDLITLAVGVIGQYIRFAVLPHPLSAQYAIPLHFYDRIGSTFLYGGVIAVAVVSLWFARKRMPNGLTWFAIFIVMLVPVLYFQGSGILFAERYLYMPSLAVVILIADALSQLRLKAGIAIGVLLLGGFFALTALRNRDWKNDETLYRRTLQVQPASVKFWNSLGYIHLDRGDNKQAQECFLRASEHSGDARFIQEVYERYRTDLGFGVIAARESRIADAKKLLYQALEYEPKGDGAYATLAAVFMNHDHDYAKAVDLLRKAIEISPKSELNWDYMGVALLNQGLHERAISAFREALRINPNFEPAKQHLQIALQKMNP